MKGNLKAQHLTLGGTLTALTMIFLYLASIFTTNTLTLLTLASFMVPIGLIRGGIKIACMIYISSSFLCLIVVPLNIALVYILFFGVYGLVKSIIEKKRILILEIFLKLVFFNSVFVILLILIQTLLGYSLFNKLQVVLAKYFISSTINLNYVVIGFLIQLAFLIFDYALTLLIDYYHKYASKF